MPAFFVKYWHCHMACDKHERCDSSGGTRVTQIVSDVLQIMGTVSSLRGRLGMIFPRARRRCWSLAQASSPFVFLNVFLEQRGVTRGKYSLATFYMRIRHVPNGSQ